MVFDDLMVAGPKNPHGLVLASWVANRAVPAATVVDSGEPRKSILLVVKPLGSSQIKTVLGNMF